MTTIDQLITADELLRMPKDDFRYELIQGELHRMSPAGHLHGRLIINITTPLDQHVRANDLGEVYAAETGFIIATNPDTVRAPDVAFVRKERAADLSDEQEYWPDAPDLAIEVVSPHDLYTEVNEKVADWLDAGTHMVIVVNPRNQTVTVYRSRTAITMLTAQDTLDGADIIPHWRLPVTTIFR